ncbi:MAG TPA: DUF3152 domain-containing protein [Euzebya sp.]|nr:DUF3152 domain-containing protein [Euzebya sp.]
MPPSRHVRMILALSLALSVMSVAAPHPPYPVTPAVVGDKPADAANAGAADTPVESSAVAGDAAGPGQVTSPPTTGPATEVLQVPYRIELRSSDPAVADATQVIPSVLEDPRGWQQAAIDFVPDPDAPFVIVLAEGPDAQALCRPYDVGGRFSCQNGPLVVLNAIRWRDGVAHWPQDPAVCAALGAGAADSSAGPCLASYRAMLINHEVGHLLGMHHLRCAAPGAPAPVMEQQSGSLRGCLANPWPTAIELRLAGSHQFRLAPPPLDVAFPP